MSLSQEDLFDMVDACHIYNSQSPPGCFATIVRLSDLFYIDAVLGRIPVNKSEPYKRLRRSFLSKKFLPDYIYSLFSRNRNIHPTETETACVDSSVNTGGISPSLGDSHQRLQILIDLNYTIIEGSERAAQLLSIGLKYAVVIQKRDQRLNYASIRLELDSKLTDKTVESYLASLKSSFPEWYSPLELGPFQIPKVTYPDFKDVWDYDNTEGIRNWEHCIKHVLPEVQGKRIIDVGSNIGLYSLELARMGAIVCGVDRGPSTVQPNNHNLGSQSVPNQAYGIRNLYELYHNRRFDNVAFAELDLMTYDFSKLKCDIFFSCRVLYHLGKQRMEQIIRDISNNIPEVILQSNERQHSKLLGASGMSYHKKLLNKYGYTIIKEYAPVNFPHPIIYACKEPGSNN